MFYISVLWGLAVLMMSGFIIHEVKKELAGKIIRKEKSPYYITIFIFLLTALDYVLTKYGIQKGIITEKNPLLVTIFEGNNDAAVYFLLLTIGIALVFVYIIQEKKKWVKPFFYSLLIPKIAVLLLHWQWLKL